MLSIVTAADRPTPDFLHDVAPVLSRFGCNSSACHGKAEGQKGFKLSIFGNDPVADFEAFVKQSRGRRIMMGAPEASLTLQKAAGEIPHAGGVRMKRGSREYAVLRDWIASGVVYESEGRSAIVSVRVEPEKKLLGFSQSQPLRVIAKHSDGSEEDVTWLATFHSNNSAVVDVDEHGVVTSGSTVGQAAVMARYAGQITIFQATIPRPGVPVSGDVGKGFNEIDDPVNANLRRMNLRASDVADDAEYLRRVFLDVIGRLPSGDEARHFIEDTSDGKRARLVDVLLDRPEYADFWALKWADLLRVDRQVIGAQGAQAYFSWIRDSIAENKPLDAFAREIVLAEGPLSEQPAGYFFKAMKKSGETAAAVSQVFLGIRITCAECHQHPYERWTQNDYHGMRGFFEQVKYKKSAEAESLIIEGNPVIKHPRTKAIVQPHALGAEMSDEALDGDRRVMLVQWMLAPENPWFARNLANRFWAHFLGRGLVEPVDDVRATNPASNPELLDLLTHHLVESKLDAKAMIRFITASRTYQLASKTNETNEGDTQNYSRAVFRRLPAEVLMDAVCDVTAVPEKFTGVPLGTRAVQLWDSLQQHYFLKLFGRPARTTPCECERATGASISQALHLMNSPAIEAKLSHASGRVAELSRESDDARVVESLYLAAFSRLPNDAEKLSAVQHLESHSLQRRQAIEDLTWSLMNALEFVFNH